MKMDEYTFNGTGAAVYLCVGFLPEFVKVIAVEDSDMAQVEWSRGFVAAESDNGFLLYGATAADITLYTAGTGIEAYEGGELLTSANQTSVGYGEGVFLAPDVKDYRQVETYGYKTAVIDTWTLGNSTNRTGNFNSDIPASGSRIGEGSRILIEESVTKKLKWAVVEALTASQGSAANEVTLSRAVTSGKILKIEGMYDMAPLAVGSITPAGIKLNATSEINANNEIQLVRVGAYDRVH